ncbi:thiol:disulfide interchange protein DsbA/DsbL [Alishewanella sp. SMS8]|uniref:thiol:disulfide interchange protein DsbA/DsbL n=1 Tax=Alishewanella sp. SMS8 TaxID=2994676 RepID=UPI002741AC89|nr:thiol:disulfide interchange protein DsbA/DsbL [Alishewanella sp. SMS8]MDP4944362.1 thiol:disulfide interchange protein DsbA/DsbL [Alishewanella sp.]MDP5206171.1 thiol:disulfide interchange protein DsbA/DsbL [Alishewanella sp. SMS9]MDP5036977.1 thiol:disulfide interchange protein DsbA/DsbL [Alishewanella sp.]MDP5187404.1 thiol:disulfide interchange protein DsbA/DsbL [Alishewanella sp.]MDP5458952.1 thiol:disulfide interchange protein DsbA/DsbL [Alishewanella sp. SMS8]
MTFFHRTLLLSSAFLMISACSPEPSSNSPTTTVEQAAPAAASRAFTEGSHYTVLANPVLEAAHQRYITEYFWLGCPHCQNFEPTLRNYLQANPDVVLVRKHPALGERWAFDASVFYALQQSGNEQLVEPLFELYRQTREQQNTMPDTQAINAFMEQHGLDPKQLTELAQSPAVRQAMEQANREMLDNRIQGVPSVVVKGKYLVNGDLPEDVKTAEDYYELLNYLQNKP